MQKCKNPICINSVEASHYKFCKHCWWEQDCRNTGPKQPFLTTKDSNEELTVKMLKEMLNFIPDHYLVRYDSALGHVRKGDFTVYEDKEIVSINS